MMISGIKKILRAPSIAVDLGTANTRIYASALGRITEEPSWVRLIKKDTDPLVVDEYISYQNSRLGSMPLRGGVIVDMKNAITLLRPLVKQTKKWFIPPISLACAPSDTSNKERTVLAEAVLQAGASHVAIIPEVWAAAIGAGIDIALPRAQVLIDIGEGVTDMAVIRHGRLIYVSAIRTACSDLQKAVHTAVMSQNKVLLSQAFLERLTHEILLLAQTRVLSHKFITVSGIDIFKRRRVTVEIDANAVASAMSPVMNKLFKMIQNSLNKLPDTIAGEIEESGICLTGGGACIGGMDRLIAQRTDLRVAIAPDPLHSVINGAIKILHQQKDKDGWWEDFNWPNPEHLESIKSH